MKSPKSGVCRTLRSDKQQGERTHYAAPKWQQCLPRLQSQGVNSVGELDKLVQEFLDGLELDVWVQLCSQHTRLLWGPVIQPIHPDALDHSQETGCEVIATCTGIMAWHLCIVVIQ